ncbi:unnamed protein product, partial [Owenia fusiformis]
TMEEGGICCVSCKNTAKIPKSLDCGHICCLGCIQDLIKENKSLNGLVSCPECKNESQVPEGVEQLKLLSLKTLDEEVSQLLQNVKDQSKEDEIHFQTERKKADEAKKIAEKERQRVEDEKQRIEEATKRVEEAK